MSIDIEPGRDAGVVGRIRQRAGRGLVALVFALSVSSCAQWQGISNLPIPGGPGSGPGSYTVYVQMPDTLALTTNSKVLVADVYVGRVRAITMKNWVAVVTLELQKGVRLPRNATAKIGQTSLLGTQHIELAPPADNPSPQPLKNGDTIDVKNSSAFPTTEQTLASIAMVLRGGAVANLEVIQNEAYNILNGRADQIRALLGKLDTFTAKLEQQVGDITHAIDSADRILAMAAEHNDTLNRALTDLPPLVIYLANSRTRVTDAVEALGRFSDVTRKTVQPARTSLHRDLISLQRPLTQLVRAAPYVVPALPLLFTAPFDINAIPKSFRGDYWNLSLNLDLTLSSLDNGLLTGTGFSGLLRALEQSWGRNPNTMIPDVRYTSNPNDAPDGPLVERGQ
ncbi:MCE family protein [Mycobacterium helveticum]|jgi:phospholipid/cholesterol/gamma-HCH transport system substrate-binding protein|uniref:MCE family protein n=1 Tax=Mycobacterium helveticum TaxID=2592811 RepID=A0A557XVX9_9MYCO|nr:MCE family protein [Mycobacterium helveticum]TVS86165.1 MCE family protein [Mycobacterium helveticum]TVS90184.1 MCE family protein [Mycobacterium helveticum]